MDDLEQRAAVAIERMRGKYCCGDDVPCKCDEAADLIRDQQARIAELTRDVERNAAIAIKAIERATLAEGWGKKQRACADRYAEWIAELEAEVAALKARYRPSMTDLMTDPETIPDMDDEMEYDHRPGADDDE